MKKYILLSALVVILVSCSSTDQPENPIDQDKVALLKVDYLTSVFEGGIELKFAKNSNFTISSTYDSPGDFGSVQLYYKELNEKIFDGSIVWSGLGERSFPTTLDKSESFASIVNGIPIPIRDMFENVMYVENAFYPETINYVDIWDSINNLELVQNYRNTNPTGIINVFLYTPSVGGGNPAEWNWYIILKN